MVSYKKNKDGYYRASIVTGYEEDGKQKRVTVRSKTLTDFKEKTRVARNLQKQGYDFDCKELTVSEWASRWLDIYKRPKVSSAHAKAYESKLRLHILPLIGHLRVADVRPYMLQEVLNRQAGKSTSQVNKIMVCLKQIFQKAYENGIIVRDVSAGLSMPQTYSGSRRPLTDPERQAVLKTAETHYAGLWVLTMLYCGLRPEETVALMWKDINFKEGMVTISRAAGWEKGQAKLKGLKGKDGKVGEEARRAIPIPPPLLEKLKTSERRGLYVFNPVKSEGMISKTISRRWWLSFHRAVDIGMGAELYRNQIIRHAFPAEVTPYYLRHTYATDLFQMGVDLKTAQYLLGHADIKTTANIYTHFMQRSLGKAKDIINEHYKSCGQGVGETLKDESV